MRPATRLRVPFWRSEANFVLVRLPGDAARLVRQLADARHPRARPLGEPRVPGCIRITAGVVEHTRALMAALEEVLCGAA